MANIHIALLRGINVGGRNKLPMKELVALFNEAGCKSVQTYIQSGNVVFEADPNLALMIPSIINQSIQQTLDYNIPVITRAAEELSRIVQANPFIQTSVEQRELHVVFLADTPLAAAVSALDPDRSPPDEFEALGREIYLRCPNGLARTKFTNAYFDKSLATTSTMRNWRTVLKLLDLARGIN